MEQNAPQHESFDEDAYMKSQMEKMVDSYDAYMKKMTFGREHILRQRMVCAAGVKAGHSVLGVGCGTGTLTLEAWRQAGPSGSVSGIDLIPGMVEVSRRKAAEAGAEITFQLGSIADIPFPDSQFDVVMCSFMIFHMSEATRRKGIAEIHRVLKPQGRLFITDLALPSRPLPRAVARMLFGGMLEHDLHELLPLMEASGFTSLEVAPLKFRVLGLSVLAFVSGKALKNGG
jgi:ubiquinone/menaquinone biosynthesis C-methylase UbiE